MGTHLPASGEGAHQTDDEEAWRDEVIADIFDRPPSTKPSRLESGYGDWIAKWIAAKKARELEERAERRRAGLAGTGAHVCVSDEQAEAPDPGPLGGGPIG